MQPSPPAPTKKRNPLGPHLRALGFDLSRYNRSTGYWKVRCSQCEALVINGTPCHEQGCPNNRHPHDD